MTNLRLILQLAGRVPMCIEALRDSDAGRVAAAEELCLQAGLGMGESANRQIVDSSSVKRRKAPSGQIVKLTIVCTDWQSHAPLAIEAMRRGRHVAVEVPAALTLEDIDVLVKTSQETGCHCFMLENCCYDPALVDAIARVKAGEIGEPVHAEGNYYHRLGDRWTPWRLEMNRRQRGDLYPTHELAPLCMALGISPVGSVSGGFPAEAPAPDCLHTLVCMDSAPFSGPATYEHHLGSPAPDFLNGDHTTTLIRTRRGRTILLRHDVLTDIPYERLFHIVGTRGVLTVADDGSQPHDHITIAMHESLLTALNEGRPLDFSVRDLATWCAVTPLSALSIERGFSPVSFPAAFG